MTTDLPLHLGHQARGANGGFHAGGVLRQFFEKDRHKCPQQDQVSRVKSCATFFGSVGMNPSRPARFRRSPFGDFIQHLHMPGASPSSSNSSAPQEHGALAILIIASPQFERETDPPGLGRRESCSMMIKDQQTGQAHQAAKMDSLPQMAETHCTVQDENIYRGWKRPQFHASLCDMTAE